MESCKSQKRVYYRFAESRFAEVVGVERGIREKLVVMGEVEAGLE
jgi:hypothetical protein